MKLSRTRLFIYGGFFAVFPFIFNIQPDASHTLAVASMAFFALGLSVIEN